MYSIERETNSIIFANNINSSMIDIHFMLLVRVNPKYLNSSKKLISKEFIHCT